MENTESANEEVRKQQDKILQEQLREKKRIERRKMLKQRESMTPKELLLEAMRHNEPFDANELVTSLTVFSNLDKEILDLWDEMSRSVGPMEIVIEDNVMKYRWEEDFTGRLDWLDDPDYKMFPMVEIAINKELLEMNESK